ncbi:MAG TPA: DUF6263 family protein [Chitinophagaceae bacterium]
MRIKNARKIFLLSAVAALSACSSNSNKEKISLELKLTPGEKQTIISRVETNGGPMMQINNSIVTDFEVVGIDSQNLYRLVADIKQISTETKIEGQTESYDSERDEADMTSDQKSMHAEFKDILNSTFTLSLNKKGTIVNPFEYSDGRPVTAPIVDMDNIQLVFPDKKVAVGDSWEKERNNSLTGQKIKSVYTIKDISGRQITIKVRSTISGLSSLLQETKTIGQYILDKETCKLKKATIESNAQMGGKITLTYIVQ